MVEVFERMRFSERVLFLSALLGAAQFNSLGGRYARDSGLWNQVVRRSVDSRCRERRRRLGSSSEEKVEEVDDVRQVDYARVVRIARIERIRRSTVRITADELIEIRQSEVLHRDLELSRLIGGEVCQASAVSATFAPMCIDDVPLAARRRV